MPEQNSESEALLRAEELLPPNILDTSTGVEGIVANEIATENELTNRVEPEVSSTYGAASQASENEENVGTSSSPSVSLRRKKVKKRKSEQFDASGYAVPPPQLYFILGSIFMGAFLAALDSTVVTTLLTVISSDLDALPKFSWIATSYLLAMAAFQPLFGKLSDIFGRKCLLILCNLLFSCGCLICALPKHFGGTFTTLIVGRFLTGLSSGGLTTLGTIAMSDLISLRKRGIFQGIANIFFALGASTGGLVGGFISDAYGWRWVFLGQVPLAFIGAVVVYLFMNLPSGSLGLGAQDTDTKSKLKRIDVLGSVTLITALVCAMLAADLGGQKLLYKTWSFAALVTGFVAFSLVFAYVELYSATEPIVPVRLLANRTVLASSLANWFGTMAGFTCLYYIPIYFTTVLEFSSTENGLRFVPSVFLASLSSVGAGFYMKLTGKYLWFAIVTSFLSIVGVIHVALITPTIPVWDQYSLLILPYCGYSAMLTVTLLALIAAVPPEQQASSTSIQYAFRSTGSTLGMSLASAFFQSVLIRNLPTRLQDAAPPDVSPKVLKKVIKNALSNGEYVRVAPEWAINPIKSTYESSCKAAFLFALVTVTLGFISICFVKEHKLHTNIARK
ncbi:Vacuolar basic amino acid transporter 1 [Komagataella phaffii CBS 7435]|uniref:Permease of basic amino acids in the vacuolar membrane n=2 Tax=Komagataella phaffii TaxID=460519 RepID=C4R867_KOMPG|nr:Permease of basic amino acids in the vacuolar membrane [Komagataella phaffii GS115]AOA64654.1 GQ67_04902T0 [Komagataella phaffii]CAH2450815.1 Vacuolar basic amino acid transporter 1 [Komagataella phaffii CBS 7435]AOA69716.1 GQ68_04874T0 [Komagataella phaffii GS115]CAY71792.1 Permease of basic amino acids in the vacuolar membrane [Komagataella phaffii GS115]CCA40609.1 Vacuolar basic amino acid transporter 1 [Komagataella phaffii CBS 7435]